MPSEYNGPIITDFLSWLNPYDSLPTNKDGILLASPESLAVRHALTVVKSGLIIKSGPKTKRKSSALSSRTRGKRERNTDYRKRVIPHSCCQQNEEQSGKQIGKYRTESANKVEKNKVDRSVGNKRCYIDPIEWERETASILRPTLSVQNKMACRLDSIRQTKSGIISSYHKPILDASMTRNDSTKKLSAIGHNICKLRDENKANKGKSITFADKCTLVYTPFRVVMTPVNDSRENLK